MNVMWQNSPLDKCRWFHFSECVFSLFHCGIHRFRVWFPSPNIKSRAAKWRLTQHGTSGDQISAWQVSPISFFLLSVSLSLLQIVTHRLRVNSFTLHKSRVARWHLTQHGTLQSRNRFKCIDEFKYEIHPWAGNPHFYQVFLMSGDLHEEWELGLASVRSRYTQQNPEPDPPRWSEGWSDLLRTKIHQNLHPLILELYSFRCPRGWMLLKRMTLMIRTCL